MSPKATEINYEVRYILYIQMWSITNINIKGHNRSPKDTRGKKKGKVTKGHQGLILQVGTFFMDTNMSRFPNYYQRSLKFKIVQQLDLMKHQLPKTEIG